jgi:ATP-dependent DNA helicase RecQ
VNIPPVSSRSAEPEEARDAFKSRRTWSDYGRRGQWSVFYAPAGGRLRSVDPLSLEPALSYRRAASQAAFFLANTNSREHSDSPLIASLRRIMTRGDRPPVDPLVEDWTLEAAGLANYVIQSRDPGDLAVGLSSGFSVPDREEVRALVTWRESFEFDRSSRAPEGQPIVDSPAERDFLAALLGDHGGAIGHWVVPQASMGSLIGDRHDQRRVDFLISHPGSAPTVVELDGSQHGVQIEVDRDRDAALAGEGFTVERIGSREASTRPALKPENLPAPATAERPSDSHLALLWAPIIANRVARAMIEGLACGALNGPTWQIEIDEPTGVGPIAARSTLDVIAALADVWNEGIAPDNVLVTAKDAGKAYRFRRASVATYVATAAKRVSSQPDLRVIVDPFHGPWHRLPDAESTPTIVVRSASLPIDLREGRLEGGRRQVVADAARIDRESLERILRGVFGKREFYPSGADHPRGQEVAIRRLLSGRDAVALLPTGAGKSMIYQFVGLLLPGRTVVIDPIVALIDDQVDGLARQGIDQAIGITRDDTAARRTEAKLEAIQAGDAMFCFVAPERLQQRRFRDALRSMSVATPVNVCVVDEAHCVSEWGHDFRTSYLDIGRVLREVASDTRGSPPPLLALTGTASRSVLRDLMIELDIDRSDPETIVAPKDFDRPELQFDIVRGSDDETVRRMLGALRSLPARFGLPESVFFAANGPDSFCGIVFSQTVNPSKSMPDGGLLKLQSLVADLIGAPVGIYSGSRPRDWQGEGWEAAKRRYASDFKSNRLTVLVSTKAYGMGIDKPNIRYIVHVGLPGSIEAYYQEAGRAGRDRQIAHCILVHDRGARGFHDYVQGKNYRGPDADIADVRRLLTAIGKVGSRRNTSVPKSANDEGADNEERAIHRLKVLGVIDDYLVDWGGRKFDLRLGDVDVAGVDARLLGFVRRTLAPRVPQFEAAMTRLPSTDLHARIEADASLLINFVYETVVSARERALEEMVRLADEAQEDSEIRIRILRYLELGKVAGELESLVYVPTFCFEDWQPLYQQLDTVDDGREWRGATARFLVDAPDHPGLLVGRALAEAIVPDGDVLAYLSNLQRALGAAPSKYLVTAEALADFCEWLVGWVHDRRRAWSALTMIVVERAIGEPHLEFLRPVEDRIIREGRSIDSDELAVVLARRLDRAQGLLTSLAEDVRELG